MLSRAFAGLPSPGRFVLDTTIRVYWRDGSNHLEYLRSASPTSFAGALRALISSDSLSGEELSRDVLPEGADLTHLDPFAPNVLDDQWRCFVARVSRVGLDTSRTRAAVYADVICTGFAAGGVFLLELNKGTWVLSHDINLWMSEG